MLHAVEKKAIGISNYARAREEREAAYAAAGIPRHGERMFSSKVASLIRQPTPFLQQSSYHLRPSTCANRDILLERTPLRLPLVSTRWVSD